MENKIRFRKGQIVRSGSNAVLVTGPGDKKAGYPTFSGVVIMAIKNGNDDEVWPVGMYSNTWTLEAFKKIDLPLSNIIEDEIKAAAK